MLLRFERDYLDFKKDQEYIVEPLNTAKYIIAMGIAKEVVSKNGKKAIAPKKAKVEIIEDVVDPDNLLGL